MSLPMSKVRCGRGDAPVTGACTPMTISLLVTPEVSSGPGSCGPPAPSAGASSPPPPPPPVATSVPATPLFCPHAAPPTATASRRTTRRERWITSAPLLCRGPAPEGAADSARPPLACLGFTARTQGDRGEQRDPEREWDQEIDREREIAGKAARLGPASLQHLSLRPTYSV